MNTLTTLWDWSEKFIRQGFRSLLDAQNKHKSRLWIAVFDGRVW